eukprot:824442-Pelagomonas_calceolata.AAC.1
MTELGCYNDDQRQEVNVAEAWACPACASLSKKDKINRAYKPEDELLEVCWLPSWEPEGFKTSWPIFDQCIQDIESLLSKPNFLLPTLDSALSNLERQVFNKSDINSTWNQELDIELRNEIIIDNINLIYTLPIRKRTSSPQAP